MDDFGFSLAVCENHASQDDAEPALTCVWDLTVSIRIQMTLNKNEYLAMSLSFRISCLLGN